MAPQKTILVLCRHLEHMGGVVKYCTSIFNQYKSDTFALEHFPIGKRPGRKSNFLYVFSTLWDFFRLFFKLFDKRYCLVHLNPSLGFSPLLRDSFFLLIAKLHSKKVLVFWHGWEKKFEDLIDSNYFMHQIFKLFYSKSDSFVVLASAFKNKLTGWGFTQPIFIETTTVEDELINGFSPGKKIEELQTSNRLKILFFSRIHVSKGIFETVDAFLTLIKTMPELELIIAGDGPDYESLRQRVQASGDDRIKLAGYVRGETKRCLLNDAHLMCLPTTHGEGIPISVLEAMAFAMPIIVSPVGGLPDILREKENVYYINTINKESLAGILSKALSDRKTLATMAANNFSLAKKQFLASMAARRLDRIYNNLVTEVSQ